MDRFTGWLDSVEDPSHMRLEVIVRDLVARAQEPAAGRMIGVSSALCHDRLSTPKRLSWL